ncbi:conserved hypothetical protein [Verticillium alfalfae VaMs.102]|uniref:DUF7928 domain-containing protein n=1 Tax=Verticillium alfalfae (strain VaMs.102 / ATCC MYA-4576 / FGSC 10136) TaxID=526221 RepID=C9S9S8_VERA1|nr:conserved hypothetical protein [Verticillium alfalfae VaMs.102]EEY16141.1 conserved hypothetical protein [Verticillium alfalfae VaMs.102]
MGIGSYFKASSKPEQAATAPPRAHKPKQPSAASEKPPSDRFVGNDMELQAPTPRFSSRPQSVSGRSTKSAASSMFLDDIKHEVMVNYLYQQQCSHLWVSDGSGEIEGVLLRKHRGQYMACPPQLGSSPFAQAAAALNVQCAMTVNSRVIKTFLQWSPDAVDVPLMNGLPKAIESELMELVWKAGNEEEEEGGEKRDPNVAEVEIDEESGEIIPEKRPVHLMNTWLVTFTLILVTVALGAAWRSLALQIAVDGNYVRLALISLFPIQVFTLLARRPV